MWQRLFKRTARPASAPLAEAADASPELAPPAVSTADAVASSKPAAVPSPAEQTSSATPADAGAAAQNPAASSPQKTTAERDRMLFKSFISALYDAILIVDVKGYILAANRRTETVLGYTEADLWDTPCARIIENMNEVTLAKVREKVADGRFAVMTANCKKKDGLVIPVEIAASCLHFLSSTDLLFSIRRNDARELPNIALRYAGAGLLVCGENGCIEYASPAFLRMLNYRQASEVQGRSLRDLCASAKTVDFMLRVPSEKTIWTGYVVLTAATGAKVNFRATAAQGDPHPSGLRRIVITIMTNPDEIKPLTATQPISVLAQK